MTNTPEKQRPERKPQCQNKLLNNKAERRRCTNDGVACWVSGEFGRNAMTLCNRCIQELRGIGWNVRYQLEGDNPPPLPNELLKETR